MPFAERESAVGRESVTAFSERGRMHWRNAGEVPAKAAIAHGELCLGNWPGKHGKMLELRELGWVLLRK